MLSIMSNSSIHFCRPFAMLPYMMLNRGLVHRTACLISSRYFSKQSNSLNYVPHKFSTEEAAKKFAENDQKRFFAPIQLTQSEALTIHVNPIKKILIPIFGVNAKIIRTDFDGEEGHDRIDTEWYWENNELKSRTRIVTDWYNISGTLGPETFSQYESGMNIYGGFSYDSGPIEEAMGGFDNDVDLREFDAKSLDAETVVDPFLKRAAIAQETGYDRITSYEKGRAARYIKRKTGADQTRVYSVSITYGSFKLSSYLLPSYILQYAGVPPLIMPAFKHDVKIIGPSQLSVTKLMTVSGAAATAISLLFPQVAIPVRVIMVIASTVTGGLWAKFGLSVRNSMQQGRIEKEKNNNETVSESISDRNRRMSTEGHGPTSSSSEGNQKSVLDLDPKFFLILDLDPYQPITEEVIREAFNKQIKIFHPDHNQNGSDEIAKDLINARQVMLEAVKNTKSEGPGKRNFSTMPSRPNYIENLVKEPPRSIYHPQARVLIDTVLIEKNYKKALQLVMEDEIHPDSHDKGENTLLVTLVKDDRGTLADMKFAVDDLDASLDSSCDCPAHRTPLHYGASRGNLAKVKFLLERGASPNLITSFGETALDLAITKGHNEVADYIRSKGGVQHKTLEGSESFWKKLTGYKSSERTILLNRPETKALQDKEKVIHLPSPKKK